MTSDWRLKGRLTPTGRLACSLVIDTTGGIPTKISLDTTYIESLPHPCSERRLGVNPAYVLCMAANRG